MFATGVRHSHPLCSHGVPQWWRDQWWNEQNQPVLVVDQCRLICCDVILGLKYHASNITTPLSMYSPFTIFHSALSEIHPLQHQTGKSTLDRRSSDGQDYWLQCIPLLVHPASNPNDPILLDDSDLSKCAGTPPFLALEVIAKCTSTEPSSSVSASATSSILLPSKSGTHINLSGTIHSWESDETMGCDAITTGGHWPDPDCLNIPVMRLDQSLQKDVSKWITINNAKVSKCVFWSLLIALDNAPVYSWILSNISEPAESLHQTSPNKSDTSNRGDREGNDSCALVGDGLSNLPRHFFAPSKLLPKLTVLTAMRMMVKTSS